MNKAENIRYMILKQCRRRSLTELCDAWEVTIDDFYAYLDSNDKLLGNTADDWMGMYHIAADRADKAEAENAKLRAVVEAARKALNDVNCPTQDDLDNDVYEDYYHECFDRELCPNCGMFKLGQALAELDKEEG